MSNNIVGIYKVTNLINQKFYIGMSKNIFKRWKVHKNLKRKLKTYFDFALLKYGTENFKFEIIEECESENINEKEIYWIAKLKPEYNLTKGGTGGDTWSLLSEENKKLKIEKLRKSCKISHNTESYKEYAKKAVLGNKNPMHKNNFTFTPELLEKWRLSHLGEKNGMYGKKRYTNGKENIVGIECPRGFRPGITHSIINKSKL